MKDGDTPIHAGAKQSVGVFVIVRKARRARPEPIRPDPRVGRCRRFVQGAGNETWEGGVNLRPRPKVITDVADLPIGVRRQNRRVPLGA
ncbi:MAG: hypothetical protein SLRJCFUN_001831 [Candidatus Fervidibacter sp.]